MTNRLWSLVEMAARPLESDTRAAVLGDLEETGESAWRGLLDVLELVVRRQWQFLKDWRPWLAVFGLALPSSLVLMGLSVSISSALETFSDDMIHEAVLQLLCRGFLLIGCSWACGFAMGSISRKTFWVSGIACCFPCLLCLVRFREPSLSRLCLFLFLLPAIWGVRQALRSTRISLVIAFLLATSITTLMITFANNKSFWTLNWVLVWPVWYIAAARYRREAQPI